MKKKVPFSHEGRKKHVTKETVQKVKFACAKKRRKKPCSIAIYMSLLLHEYV